MLPILRVLAYPLLIGVALAAAGWLQRQDIAPPLVVTAVGAMSLGAAALLERLIPYREDWQRSRGDVLTDALHLLLSVGVAGELGRQAALSLQGSLSVWPTGWPLALQLPLALVVAELFVYALHRAQHSELPPWAGLLWRIHAVHHSAERLYVLNASRVHPLDSALTSLCLFAPLIGLGAEAELVTLFTVATGAHSALQHANLDLRLGPLDAILAAAPAHRGHHSVILEESRGNYGQVLLVWDHLFGTWRRPVRGELRVGLTGSPVPPGWLGQLLAPFVSRRGSSQRRGPF